MKKILALFVIAGVIFALAACGKEDNEETTQGESTAQVVNPVKDSDSDAIKKDYGIDFSEPEGAATVSYHTISDETAQMDFILNGVKYCARAQKSEEYSDISGMYYQWTSVTSAEINGCEAQVHIYEAEEENAGSVTWIDESVPMVYSLSADSADSDEIVRVAREVFG